MIRASILALLILCGSVADAAAEVGSPIATVQATAANAAWLAYAPPPITPAVVCLVDSGVDLNPDTESIIVGSHALYPETSTGDEMARLTPPTQPGGHPDGHGTLMAMLMAAPANDLGMVGIAPSAVRVYNMKALQNNSTQFSNEKEAEGIAACIQLKQTAYPTLTVINLSLSSESNPQPATASEIDNEITTARNQGISVVAAAGNNGGALEFPASYPGVLAVGAEDTATPGALCSFSSRGEGLSLLAPGCDTLTGGLQGAFQDTGEPNISMGTSQASSEVSAVLAPIRAYAPTLTRGQAEYCITSTLRDSTIDAAAAYETCGLTSIVHAGIAAEPKPNATIGSPTVPAATTYNIDACQVSATCTSADAGQKKSLGSFEQHACPVPRLLASARRGRRLTIAVHPVRGCSLQARTLTPEHGKKRWLTLKRLANRMLSLGISRDQLVEIRFISPSHEQTPSRWNTIRPG